MASKRIPYLHLFHYLVICYVAEFNEVQKIQKRTNDDEHRNDSCQPFGDNHEVDKTTL